VATDSLTADPLPPPGAGGDAVGAPSRPAPAVGVGSPGGGAGEAGAGAGRPGSAETAAAVLQLCGELVLQDPPALPPTIARSWASVGLELIDLLLNPDHIVRVTEVLTLRNTLMLDRRVQLDISLDRLSREQEEGATQLSVLVSNRVGLDEAHSGRERLWVPLDSVPRPIPVAVTVADTNGEPLPRPPQLAVRRALASALDHILLESLRADPDVDQPGRPVHTMMRQDYPSRWLLQSAIQSIAQLGPTSRRARDRLCALQARVPALELELSEPGIEPRVVVDALALAERPSPSYATALTVVREVLLADGPFLELLRLVHGHYFVVAGLDRRARDHMVSYDLPDSEALADSAIRSLHRRLRAAFDPRQHNYCAHIQVPLPDNVDQYNLDVQAASREGAAVHNEVSLVGAIHFDGHPVRSAIEALSACADRLEGSVGDAWPDDTAARRIGYVASRAAPALDALDAVVDHQDQAADELEARAGRASKRIVQHVFARLRTTTAAARERLGAARQQLGDLVACLRRHDGDLPPSRVRGATAAVRDAIGAMEHPLLTRRLVSSELTGREVGRLRLDRSVMAAPAGSRARTLEVWATVSDESRPYAHGAIGPPLGMAVLVYLAGALLFDALAWPFHVARLVDETIASRQADAVVGVLLLIPGFALTQFKLPDRWSVSGWLHRPGHLFVLVAIVTLGVTSIVVATQVGGGPESSSTHPHIVLWTFRAALGVFGVCTLWATVAALLRKWYSWRPKGLRSLLDVEPAGWSSGTAPDPAAWSSQRRRPWLSKLWRYGGKPPDADFDLTRPSPSASRQDVP
jgi:hypothetical protein